MRRWMTPRGIIAASHYAPAAPTMTQFVSLHLHQLEVKNAILHGGLPETLYMYQPMGF